MRFALKKFPLLGLAVLLLAAPLYGQDRGVAKAMVAGKAIAIDYGRPSLKGRDMVSEAQPGMIWRLGKNEATTIKTEADLQFGDVSIPKGHYSLWAKKIDAKTWHLIFNKQTGQWGTAHDASQDFAEVPLKVEPLSDSVETFTISIDASGKKGTMKFDWGKSQLVTDFMAH